MAVSRAFLDRCAAETGYGPGALEKVVRLGEMASALNAHPRLRSALLLKGGTPLNLAFGTPTRLSVDLDYNYVGAVERDAMRAERPSIEQAIVEIAERTGYRVQQSADEFAGRKFFLAYRSALGGADRIEVDISYLFRIPLEEPRELSLWQPGGLDPAKVAVVSPIELVVGKVLALLHRAAPRDAWDLAMLPDALAAELRSHRLRSWLIAMSAVLDHPVTTYTRERMEALLTQQVVEERLVPMLAAGHRVNAGMLARDSWDAVAPLLELTDQEREYVESISAGEAPTELLFPDDRAYVADTGSGLQVIDISDPVNPAILGSWNTITAMGVAVAGTVAYVADPSSGADGVDGIHLIDVLRCTVGACCVAGQCVELIPDDQCLALGGTFLGVGTACTGGFCSPPCPGDVDGDGTVGINDFLDLLAAWGPCPTRLRFR